MKYHEGIWEYITNYCVGCTSKNWDINQPFYGDILKLGTLIIMFFGGV